MVMRAGPLVIAAFLVYLTLRRTDLAEISNAFAGADYWWCIPLIAVTVGSHWVRAWRWQAFLEVLPEAKRPPRVAIAFGSVIIGFMVNFVLPRVGEFVRAAKVARSERLPYAGVLGTVVTERVIDLLTLAAGLAISVLLLTGEQRTSLNDSMLMPAYERLVSLPVPGLVAGVLAGATLMWWITTRRPVRRWASTHLASRWASFAKGLTSAHRSRRKVRLAVSTVIMWLMYTLMAYIPLEMFHIADVYNLRLVDGLVIMFVGVLGVVVPTPGGAGSFHYITVLMLTTFYGVPDSLAATYAVFVHGAQLVLYLALGLLMVAIQDTRIAQLRADMRRTG